MKDESENGPSSFEKQLSDVPLNGGSLLYLCLQDMAVNKVTDPMGNAYTSKFVEKIETKMQKVRAPLFRLSEFLLTIAVRGYFPHE